MWKEIGDRESGKLRPSSFTNRIKSSRESSLQLSNNKEIVSAHRGSINSLQVHYHHLLSSIFPFILFCWSSCKFALLDTSN